MKFARPEVSWVLSDQLPAAFAAVCGLCLLRIQFIEARC